MQTFNRRTLIVLGASMIAAPAFAQDESAPANAKPEEAGEIKDFTIGSKDAPIEIVEYASYTCTHCAAFHANVYPQLKKDYIDTGKVRLALREVYFDRYGLWAAMVARCGGEMRYFGISDLLFDKQNDWATSQDPVEAVKKLRQIGLSAGLTNDQLDACLADGKKAEALVAYSEARMKEQDVNATPTLIINGEKYSNMSYDKLKAIIEEKLKG